MGLAPIRQHVYLEFICCDAVESNHIFEAYETSPDTDRSARH
jgi:hypothetical protein